MPNDPKSFLSTDGLQTLIANIKASLGATDYDDLSDKPKLNNVTVQGNKTSTDFGLQDKIDSSHKLNADLIDDSESINKFVTAAEKTAWNKSVSYMNIPNSGDLNDYYGAENAGNYLCTDANVSTLSHKPSAITTAFRMDVIFYNDQTIQVIYPNDEKCVSFLRIYKNNTWSEWKESAIEMTILSYGNSTWDEFMKAYLLNSIVYCRAGSSTPQTSPQLRLAFMAYVNDEADPTEVEFQYYRSVTNKSDSAQGDEVYVYKLNKTSGWSNLKRNAYSKVAVAAPITKSYASGTVTISHADSGVTAGTYDSVTVDAQGHVTAGSNYTTSQAEQDAEIAVIANTGAKNLLEVTSQTQTIDGVTFTVNADQTITVNGTNNTQNAITYVVVSIDRANEIPDGDYILSGCPQGGGTSTYDLRWYLYSSGKSAYDNGSGATVNKNGNTTSSNIAIIIRAGVTVSNLVFSPMLRHASIVDGTFVPYAKTNRELTVENDSQQSEIDYAVNTGAKNILNPDIKTQTVAGVTYTVRSDGSILANGTAAAQTVVASFYGGQFTLPKGDWLLNGCPSGGSTSSYMVQIKDNSHPENPADGIVLYRDFGTGDVLISISTETTFMYVIRIVNGYTANNVMFKPMIRPASITDPTFVPYARSNPVLTAEMDYAVNTGTKNIFNIQATSAVQRTTTVLNPDGGITISCNAAVWATRNVIAEIPAGDYICSLFVDAVTIGGGTFAFFINQSDDQSTWTELARQTPITSISKIDKLISVTQKYLRISTNINNSDTSATNSATIRLMIRPASITDPTFQPYAKTNRELTVLTDEDRAALAEVVDNGAKNLVQIMQDSLSIYNIVFSVNKLEGKIIITGTTASAYKAFRFFGDPDNTGWSYGIPIPKGTYVLSGLPSGAAQTGVRYILGITTSQSDTRTTTQIWDGDYVFTITNNTTRIDLAAYVPAGQDLSTPFVFKPMICTKYQWDVSHQFEPYALPNPTLTPAVIKAVDEGKKNLLPITIQTQTVKTVVFTVNSDGTITANGTVTGGDAYLNLETSIGNKYTGNILSGGVSNLKICISKGGSGQIAVLSESSEGVEIPDNATNTIFLFATNGTQLNNVTVKPMICTAADWAISQKFVPYAPTNRELYEMIGNINTILQGVL